jgi:hypothetical protein
MSTADNTNAPVTWGLVPAMRFVEKPEPRLRKIERFP